MNRYVVVRDLNSSGGSSVGNLANWLVVDLSLFLVITDCGDSQSQATKTAQALNDLDGGPL